MSIDAAPAQWYAIRTRARAEQTVADRLLSHAAIEPFFPRYLEPVKWSDRIHRTFRPLFAGYLFARFDSASAEIVIRTAGVVQILAESVPDSQIESLRIACQVSPMFHETTYRPGELVRITSGPFSGCEGLIDRAEPNRLTLKIDLLRRAVSVQIDRKTSIERVRSNG